MQIQRVGNYYGEQKDPIVNADRDQFIPKLKEPTKDEHTYVMVEGTVLMTREDNWKENELGRIFTHFYLSEYQ